MKILIADDAPLIRQRLCRLFGELDGVDGVIESSGCGETLEAIDNEAPEVVLLDLFMGDGTALDVLRSLVESTTRPFVVVMTAWADESVREQCLQAGADYFFSKNADFMSAVDTVRSMVSQRASS